MLKRSLTIALILTCTIGQAQNSVGVGTTTPNASAQLDISSTTKGVLLPRMNATQRTGIGSPAAGLLLYQTDDGSFYFNASTLPAIPHWKRLLHSDDVHWDFTAPNLLYNNDAFNVGIGTSTPAAKLHIGNSQPEKLRLENSTPLANGVNTEMYFKSGNHFTGAIKTLGTGSNTARLGFFTFAGVTPSSLLERLSITDEGDVGIENTTPHAPLSFKNAHGSKISLWGSSEAANYGLGIQADLLQVYSNGSGADIAFGYGGSAAFTERMRIRGNGNVGIGTSNPNAPLGFPAVLGKKITLYPGGTGDVGMAVQGNLFQLYGDHFNTDIAFGFDAAGTFTERMRVKGNGNVGVGTAAPAERLHVSGHLRLDGALKINGNSGTAGQVLTSDGFSAPTWEDLPVTKGFHVSTSSLVNITDGITNNVLVPFSYINSGNQFNDLPGFNNATNTFTAPESGLYDITIQIAWFINAVFAGDRYFKVDLFKGDNGPPSYSALSNTMLTSHYNVGSTSRSQVIHVKLKLDPGDQLQVRCSQNSGVTQQIDNTSGTFFAVTLLK